MTFQISGAHIPVAYLVGVGLVVGVLGGFFGVGGSFLVTPALFGFGVPMNFVVGTDLMHVVGKSIVAARKHRQLGNIDLKLGFIMMAGTIPGVEAGAQLIEHLKRTSRVDMAVGITFVVFLVGMSFFMLWEGRRLLPIQWHRGAFVRRKPISRAADKPTASAGAIKWLQLSNLPPYVSLPSSGIKRISLWSIIGVSLLGGFLSGFLGGGAGYFRMPSMIYLLGIPTHTAVGTDLFEIIVSAGYGTVTHAVKGNVDALIALVMHTGAAIGAQAGAIMTEFVNGPTLRVAFAPLLLVGAAIILHSLFAGHPAGVR